MKRCARSVLLWSLGFYTLTMLSVNVILDRWFPGTFERLYRTKCDQLRQLAKEPDRTLVVMLGSSRTDGAFQAGRLDGTPGPDGRLLAAYNFGIPAAGPLHEYQYVRDMLDEGIRPRLLILEVLPVLFSRPHHHLISEEDWPVADWMTWHQFVRMHPYFERPGNKVSEWLAARLAPWHTHRSVLHALLPLLLHPPPKSWRAMPFDHDRWGCRYPDPLNLAERIFCQVTARDYIPSLKRIRLGDGPVRALRDLLTLCREENILVALVLTPESTEYRSWYQPECLKIMHDLLAELQATYGVEVIDATSWLNDYDFIDGHHLDASGAAKFTARMSDEVRRLLRCHE